MATKKEIGKIEEGSNLEINNLPFEVTRAEYEVNVDHSVDEIKVDETGKTVFLKDRKGDEYHIYFPFKGKNLVLEKIKRKYISSPWEYEVLEKIKVKSFAFKK